eukprot:scaffold656_cov403-Pavlova_lutheri.AAC.12
MEDFSSEVNGHIMWLHTSSIASVDNVGSPAIHRRALDAPHAHPYSCCFILTLGPPSPILWWIRLASNLSPYSFPPEDPSDRHHP